MTTADKDPPPLPPPLGEDEPPLPFIETIPAAPIPVDAAAERAAFEALLALLKATDDGDSGTVVTILSAEEFADETFTPTTEEKPE